MGNSDPTRSCACYHAGNQRLETAYELLPSLRRLARDTLVDQVLRTETLVIHERNGAKEFYSRNTLCGQSPFVSGLPNYRLQSWHFEIRASGIQGLRPEKNDKEREHQSCSRSPLVFALASLLKLQPSKYPDRHHFPRWNTLE